MRTHAAWLALAAVIALVGCDQVPSEPEASTEGAFAKGGDKGKPGGGNGGGEPVDPSILFTNPIGGRLGYTLYLMDETGAMKRVLVDSEENNVENIDPRWSPDASRFLVKRSFYIKRVGWTSAQLWIADADGSNLGLVLDAVPGPARWLGNERIVFIDSGGDLVATSLDGLHVDPLTFTGDIEGFATSPDGSRILASVDQDQAMRLYTVSCSPCVITSESEFNNADLGLDVLSLGVEDWAHSSDRVLVSVGVGWGNSDLSVVDLTGPLPTASTIVESPFDEYNAAWSEDDSRIVFARFPSAADPRSAGIVIREFAAGTEVEVATSVGPMGIDWRPTIAGGE